MTVQELIDILKDMPPDMDVLLVEPELDDKHRVPEGCAFAVRCTVTESPGPFGEAYAVSDPNGDFLMLGLCGYPG